MMLVEGWMEECS